MDDANLKKLVIDQSGLTPDFNKDNAEYKLTVASNVEFIKISATTSDNGASFSIKSSSTGWADMGELKVTEGENKITIEVTSEDGTVKKYTIDCTRLSPSDAKLKSLDFKDLFLEPKFESDVFEYDASVGYQQMAATFCYSVFDPNCAIKVTSNSKSIEKEPSEDNANLYSFELSYGFTEVCINVTSPDKSKQQDYMIQIIRNPMARLSVFTESKDKMSYLDPISLAPIYCAFKINKTGYSLPFIHFFQNISADDPLNEISLSVQENQYALKSAVFNNIPLENSISDSSVRIPLINGTFSNDSKISKSAQLTEELNKSDKFSSSEEVNAYVAPEELKSVESLPPVQVRSWEKQLQNIYNETSPDTLINMSQSHFEKYISLVNEIDIKKTRKLDPIIDESEESSPLYALNMSIYCTATAIKYKPRDLHIHIKLAMLLEEKSMFESFYGRRIKEGAIVTLNSQNKAAHESSKEEDIAAICKLRNYGPNPSNTDILKALDEEYHYCLETGQNHKADQLQGLYLFKSKKISDNMMQGDQSESVSEGAKELMKHANLKYLDAMSIMLETKQTNHFMLDFLIGRSLCLGGDYAQALVYLKECLNWADNYFKTLARFYYGFAIAKQGSNLTPANAGVVVNYLGNGLQIFVEELTEKIGLKRQVLFAEDHLNILNIVFLEAFLLIGKIVSEFEIKYEVISTENAYRYCAWLCCIAFNQLDSRTIVSRVFHDSRLFKDLHRVLIESHTKLIMHRLVDLVSDDEYETHRTIVAKQCVGLLNLIRSSGNKADEEILRLQERISQILVYADPLNAYHLLLLGAAKYELSEFLFEHKRQIYEKEFFDEILKESEGLLISGFDLQMNKTSEAVSESILYQKWWKKLHESLLNQKIKAKEDLLKKNAPPAPPKVTPAKKPPAVTPRTSKTPVKQPNPPPAAAKGKPAAAKPPVKNKIDANKTASGSKTEISSVDEGTAVMEAAPEAPPIYKKYLRNTNISYNLFIVVYQTQLYLARIYVRLDDQEKAKHYYEQVIIKEPKKQDGYVELANMLKKNGQLMEAVDVYANFPITEITNSKTEQRPVSATNPPINLLKRKKKDQSHFDDAFIYGELILVLMNEKKYDDPRLIKYLILWGKIMGTGIIEKDIMTLNKANKTQICKQVFAGIHDKPIDDPDLVQFFNFKGW